MDRNLCVVIHCRRHCLKLFICIAHVDDVCVQSKLLLLEQVSYLSYDWSYLYQTGIAWFWCMLWYSIWTRHMDEPYVRMLEEVKAFGATRSNVLGADALWWPYHSYMYFTSRTSIPKLQEWNRCIFWHWGLRQVCKYWP